MWLHLDSGTDDYYVLEADLSSTGGYVNLINISVPISKIIFLGLISNLLQTNWVILLLFVSHVCQFSSCPYIISKSTSFTDQLQPEVIQRRSSITAPMSPRSSTSTNIITIIHSTIVTSTNSSSRSYYFVCIFPKIIQFRDPVHLLREEIEALNKVEKLIFR